MNTTVSSGIYSDLAVDPDLAELVDLFVAEIPNRIEQLTSAAATDDWEGVRRVAHQMKGAAGSYGFSPVTTVAARVEDSIRTGCEEATLRMAVADLEQICSLMRSGMPA